MQARPPGLGFLTAALWLGVLGFWLADVSGPGTSPGFNRTLVIIASVCVATWCGSKAVTAWRGRKGLQGTKAALVLFALALLVRFAGIDFELIDHPRSDEGVYLALAERINSGQLLPETFNYGHLLYYAGALALWIRELFPDAATAVAKAVYGVETPLEVSRILLKSLNAFFGALTTLAVFGIASRIAGTAAAVLAGLLITFSPLYNDVAHQVISDVPAAFFATLALMFVARLLGEENHRDYLLAGAAAGLAAASKYPGGVAAIAIFAVWLYWRLRLRNWSWTLVGSAAVSILTMLAVMPALVLSYDRAFSGHGLDVFFGFRQYAFGGWLGVERSSNALWYGNLVLESFGVPAMALGLGGLVFLARKERRRLALMLPFPALYLILIGSMSMAVHRNLQPALPILAAILGVGIAGWIEFFRRLQPDRSHRWAVLVGVAALILPTVRTLAWDFSRIRPGTRQMAREWIEDNVPEGAAILKEDYTSQLNPRRHVVKHLRFAARLPPAELRTPVWDYLLLARNAHRRFLTPNALSRPHHREMAQRYRELFELDQVREFVPGPTRAGAHLLLYRVEPEVPEYRAERRFGAGEASFVSDRSLRQLGAGKPLQFTREWQYALFKDFFEEGTYRVSVTAVPEPAEAYLYVFTADNRGVGGFALKEGLPIELPRRGKYFLRLSLSPPSRFQGMELRRIERSSDGEGWPSRLERGVLSRNHGAEIPG
jgi:4-amino-4-deoxy-L-arabinose transferase-like glycosyltransferase